MFRLRGFRASLNFNSGKTSGREQSDISPGISLNGAYRTNKDDLFGSNLYSESPKKITPSMVKLPTKQSLPSPQSKSTSDLTKPSNEAITIRRSTPDISQVGSQLTTKVNIKNQKKLEKQRLAEQKKQEKIAEKVRQREEKLRREREKQYIAQQTRAAQKLVKKEEQNKPKRQTAPQPQNQPTASQPQQRRTSLQPQQQRTAPQAQQKPTEPQTQQKPIEPQKQQKRTAPQPQQQQMLQTGTSSDSRTQGQNNTTNTLESSISKSSGPPPYSSSPEVTPNRNDGSGFAKPVDDMDSWGLISQHRQQMNKQAGVSKSAPKQTHLDLHYNVGSSNKEKSNA